MAEIRAFQAADQPAVLALWDACGLTVPWNDPRKDIARKMAEEPGELLVAVADGSLIGTSMAGYDGHRGWIYYLAVAERHRRDGVGLRLVTACEELLAARGCPKVNLMVRAGNADAIEFYARAGYARSDVVTLGKRLVRDD